ncbi:MAG: hypothetical protein WCW78_01225 [Candidatus Paceibacterota bacterium]|jgi:hypothetical protein
MKFSISRFIEHLRGEDEETKKWWVAGASTISMIGIVFLWVLYLNLTLPSITKPTGTSTIPVALTAPKKTSPFDTFMEGWNVVSKDIRTKWKTFSDTTSKGISGIGGGFNKKNEMIIEGDTTQFTPSTSTESLPPTKLP